MDKNIRFCNECFPMLYEVNLVYKYLLFHNLILQALKMDKCYQIIRIKNNLNQQQSIKLKFVNIEYNMVNANMD